MTAKHEPARHIFHGGCVGCLRQDRVGVDRCIECQCFKTNWNLPNLSECPPTETDYLRMEIEAKALKDEG